jgi:hypothetical protein
LLFDHLLMAMAAADHIDSELSCQRCQLVHLVGADVAGDEDEVGPCLTHLGDVSEQGLIVGNESETFNMGRMCIARVSRVVSPMPPTRMPLTSRIV